MTCKELNDFIESYVAGELPDVTEAEFKRHIEDCPPCGDYVDSYRKTIALGRGALCGPDDKVPDGMPDALVQAILETVRKTGE